jgi:hypothetical protein
MATAIPDTSPVTQVADTVQAPREEHAAATPKAQREYHCECGHALRFFGSGRHRVYFELTNEKLDDPVMDRVCPQCGRELPGKTRP